MNLKDFKKKLHILSKLPIHPQWYCTLDKTLNEKLANVPENARVLDIGCNDQWPKKKIPTSCDYIGLDYTTTADGWYGNQPSVYGDAHQLPLESNSFDYVFLFDVLEHLENPRQVIAEIFRVLKPNGCLLLEIPYIYPIHDAPRDFSRLTEHGLNNLIQENTNQPATIKAIGSPIQSAALIANISYGLTCVNMLKRFKPLGALMFLFIPLVSLLNNIVSFALSGFNLRERDQNSITPYRYHLEARKDP
ncbi:MAG: class I SAM-dependent methyltransferase [Pseudomonadales bacterium]|nr:class I SAM-dependent methyltransferase [Pseudomonadales bacterium]